MVVYSVTVSVLDAVEADWLTWMKETHIPEVLDTGYFRGHTIQKVIDPVEEQHRTTYVIRYVCEALEAYLAYQQNAAAALQKDHADQFPQGVSASRMVLVPA